MMASKTLQYFERIIDGLGHLPTYPEYVRAYNYLMQEDFNKHDHRQGTFLHEGIPPLGVFNSRIDYMRRLRLSDFLKKHFGYGGNPEDFQFESIPSAYYFAKAILDNTSSFSGVFSLQSLVMGGRLQESYPTKQGEFEPSEEFQARQRKVKSNLLDAIKFYNNYLSFEKMQECYQLFKDKGHLRPVATWYPYRESPRNDCVTPEQYVWLKGLPSINKDALLREQINIPPEGFETRWGLQE